MTPTTEQFADMVFPFDHPHSRSPREMGGLLGGKGAGLAEMTTVLGLPVPPGFTVAVPMCRLYRESGWPEGLDDVLQAQVGLLEERMGRRFGDPSDPLLLAVRSGAPRSMPGMLDTVLNLGLNDESVVGLARVSGNASFAEESYRRFLTMYATTVLGSRKGHPVPEEPMAQLRGAVEAVFQSWDSPRAQAYRAREGIDENLGTAVNVQAMVFGNIDAESGTGVVFTRNPSTGEAAAYGDYLARAQGEEVVAGAAQTLSIDAMASLLPQAYDELRRHLRRLEVHYRDLCDVEFTVERGHLWILQTRVGKRGAVAAVRAAAEMVDDPLIRLSPEEAVARVPAEVRDRARAEVLAAARQGTGSSIPIAGGLGASPGRATGAVVLDPDAAADSEGPVILVRPETSPEDVHGMSVSVGILTSTGGLVSHAAVVARGWGIPAVVGADSLVITPDGVRDRAGTRLFGSGDTITIDGGSGNVWLGVPDDTEVSLDSDEDILTRDLPALGQLEHWAGTVGAVTEV